MEFKYLTDEIWNYEMIKYKDCCPSDNSCFVDGVVNLYRGFDEDESLDVINDEMQWIIEELKNSKYYKNAISEINYDIDDSCKLGFVDVKLVPEIEVSTFKSFLKYINTHMQ